MVIALASTVDAGPPASVLTREEWDYSKLPPEETLPALRWELAREVPQLDEVVALGRRWVAGELPENPVPRWRRPGKERWKPTACDKAMHQMLGVFGDWIPLDDFVHPLEVENRGAPEFHEWLRGHARFLLGCFPRPWQALAANERTRLMKQWERARSARVVRVADWNEALRQYEKHRPDRGLPLKIDWQDHSTVLLTLNWRCSDKEITARVRQLLRELRPPAVKQADLRGRKTRDWLVKLERFGMMRLLHRHRLNELPHQLPEAWRLYGRRKIYEERRNALKDFRRMTHDTDGGSFPKSWLTCAMRSKMTPRVPAKREALLQAPAKAGTL